MKRGIGAGVLAALMACGAPVPDRAATPGVAAPAGASRDAVRTTTEAWPDAIGGVLALANPVTGEALLFRRDTLVPPRTVVVVGYDSTVQPAAIRDVRPLPCAARALLRVTGVAAGWTLALDAESAGRARPLAIDVLEDLTTVDSQRVVVRIQRALNTLPDTGSGMEFRGLPVVVRDAWLVYGPSDTLVVARAARMRNLEATAHEELRFVVLEGNQPRFVARVAGDEEVIESWDLLAALDVHGQPWLAIAREGVRSLQLEVITRDGAVWRSAWRSDALRCSR